MNALKRAYRAWRKARLASRGMYERRGRNGRVIVCRWPKKRMATLEAHCESSCQPRPCSDVEPGESD